MGQPCFPAGLEFGVSITILGVVKSGVTDHLCANTRGRINSSRLSAAGALMGAVKTHKGSAVLPMELPSPKQDEGVKSEGMPWMAG